MSVPHSGQRRLFNPKRLYPQRTHRPRHARYRFRIGPDRLANPTVISSPLVGSQKGKTNHVTRQEPAMNEVQYSSFCICVRGTPNGESNRDREGVFLGKLIMLIPQIPSLAKNHTDLYSVTSHRYCPGVRWLLCQNDKQRGNINRDSVTITFANIASPVGSRPGEYPLLLFWVHPAFHHEASSYRIRTRVPNGAVPR